MAKLIGRVYHPQGKWPEKSIYTGFSWQSLIFGIFWFAFNEMWGWFFISSVLAVATYGLSWLVFPFFFNSLYLKYLLNKGFRYL